VPRNVAQSAASKACKRLDPDNPARRTHRVPVARAVDDTLRDRFRALAAAGLSAAAIARETGADRKTVSRHLRRQALPGSVARQSRSASQGSVSLSGDAAAVKSWKRPRAELEETAAASLAAANKKAAKPKA
jgi:DNA-binding CsgD family transcriptional regulator